MTNIEQSNAKIALFMGATLDYWEAHNRAEACDKVETEDGDAIWIDQDGCQVFDAEYYSFEEVEDAYIPIIDDWSVPLEDLQYHCSFDWLMPVLEKIERTGKAKFGTYTIYGSGRCRIDCYIAESRVHTIDVLIGSSIDAIYMCVVEYLEWYSLN